MAEVPAGMFVPTNPLVRVDVYFIDEEDKQTFDVDRNITAAQLVQLVAARTRVTEPALFSIWAVSAVKNLLAMELRDTMCPLDFLDKEEWLRILKQFSEKKKKNKTPDWYECHLVFRLKSLVPIDYLKNNEDPTVVNMIYLQARYEFLSGRYILCTHEESVGPAALLLHATVGDYNKKEHKKEWLANLLQHYFPKPHLKLVNNKNDLANSILKPYQKIKETTKLESQIAFLEFMWSRPTFGCTYIEVAVKADSTRQLRIEHTVALCLSSEGVQILDGKKKKVQQTLAFEDLLDWDFGEQESSLTFTNDGGAEHEYEFYTKKGQLIADYIDAGVHTRHASLAGGAPYGFQQQPGSATMNMGQLLEGIQADSPMVQGQSGFDSGAGLGSPYMANPYASTASAAPMPVFNADGSQAL